MGLDQYAGYRDSNGEVHEEFYWRKHARLQVFFDKEYKKQNKPAPEADEGGFGDLSHLGFNGGMGGVKIDEDVVSRLEEEHKNNYWNCFASDGFSGGSSFKKMPLKNIKPKIKSL